MAFTGAIKLADRDNVATSLEEKSMGAICKSGSAPIQEVLRYSE